MKIAIIQPRLSYYVGGGEKLPIIHAKLLAEKDHNVVVYTTKSLTKNQSFLYKDFVNDHTKNIEFKEYRVPSHFAYLYEQEAGQDRTRWDTECLLFNQLIYADLEKESPDLVISYYILDGIFRPIKIPAVLYLLGYPSDELELRRSFLKFFNGTVSISKAVYDYWQKYLDTKNKNIVLNSGVYIDKTKGKLVKGSNVDIVFAGRLVDRKGVDLLIDVFSSINKEYANTHLWIIGDGPEKQKYIKKVKDIDLQKSVTFTGFVSNLKDYFKMSDICVFPSYEKEGLMGVVLEAMAEGKSVITTTDNGSEDAITNYKNGLLVKPRDKDGLINSIKKLIENKETRLKLGKNARRTIEEKFTWKIFINKLDRYLSQII